LAGCQKLKMSQVNKIVDNHLPVMTFYLGFVNPIEAIE
jgi:hypothetical protein